MRRELSRGAAETMSNHEHQREKSSISAPEVDIGGLQAFRPDTADTDIDPHAVNNGRAARIPVTVSIVSHGQGAMVAQLLHDLGRCPQVVRVVLTQNIPEDDIPCPESLATRIERIRNRHPLGFAANHNQAFGSCDTQLFAVLNPDIRLTSDPFPQLAAALESNNAGVIAPAVLNPAGLLEDSAREFPTPLRVLRRLLRGSDGRIVSEGKAPHDVDWVAGMFLLFPARTFRQFGGFDTGFHMYYEDVDICTRLWRDGQRVMIHPGATVIHDAQRASRRNIRYMAWHISSMVRYFVLHLWRLPRSRYS
jgi:N-acetylglucosaminyl-diphospho-decaprenol L-rhamnosyltransferase